MMNNQIKSILKEKIKISELKQNRNKQLVIKNILQNNNVYIRIKLYTRYILGKTNKKKN